MRTRPPAEGPTPAGDVLFVLDPLAIMDPLHDSSYVLIIEAMRRGFRPWMAELPGLALDGPRAFAHARALGVMPVAGEQPPLEAKGELCRREAASFRAIVMRKDPPVDQAFIAATWWLERARDQTVVVNDPTGLRDLSEKLSILDFPGLIPRTHMLRAQADLRALLRELGGRMIVKPLYGYGGRGVLVAREDDPNLSTLLELATEGGQAWTIAQEFLPEAARGDKRILLIDGQPVGAVMRVPARGELRNNFHAGGTPERTELSPRDREICTAVGARMHERYQLFVGIDVIGGRLTEINVTSPTGMQEVNRLEQRTGETTMQARFWDALEGLL